jgi:hypothetical protein
MFRRYAPEPLNGTPVPFKTVRQRRALIGKRIEWHEPGWHAKRCGRVQDVQWKNVLVSDNWEWAPKMLNVHVIEEKQDEPARR